MKTTVEIEHPEGAGTMRAVLSGSDARDTYKKLSDYFRSLAVGTRHASVVVTMPVAEPEPVAAKPVAPAKKAPVKKKKTWGSKK